MNDWNAWHLHLGSADPALAEQVLRDVVAPVAAGRAHWFFMRYWQGGPHIRFRIRGLDAAELTDELASRYGALGSAETEFDAAAYRALAERMAAAGEAGVPMEADELRPPGIYRERYVPELDRYGGASLMGVSEDLFRTSSRLVLAFLQRQPDPRTRNGFALQAMATALGVLDSPERVLASCRAAAESWHGWMLDSGRTPEQIEQLRLSCVTEAERIAAGSPKIVVTEGPVRRWADELAAALPRWLASSGAPAERILFSHIHMFCNRLGVSVPEEFRYYVMISTLTERTAIAH